MKIIQNLILCINEKITLPRVGFEPVTVRCLKNDKDLAKMILWFGTELSSQQMKMSV
jgi:hypothetical protein